MGKFLLGLATGLLLVFLTVVLLIFAALRFREKAPTIAENSVLVLRLESEIPERPPVELDCAVTFAPSGDVVVAALASLRKGGVVAINAIHLDRIPQFDYDSLLWGERQLRSVANMTRADARDFLQVATEIGLRPKVTAFSLEQANEALIAVKEDSIDGAAVIAMG